MKSDFKRSHRRPWADVLLIILFAGLLWLPTADYFGHLDRTQSPDENRLLAPPPRLSRPDLAGVRACVAATEAYFNDHFGFRRRLVRWNQQWRARLYRSGDGANHVIVGQNGWLYFTEADMIEHYLCLKSFTPQELQSWQRLLERRRDWLAARGIQYLFIIPPDKQSIYPEDLPSWLLQARPAGGRTKLDQFVEYMKAHSTVEILDLRPALSAGKKAAPTYLQNDSHWNLYGGFLGSQEVIKKLSQQFPALPPLELGDFDWTNAPATGGDLAAMMGAAQKPEGNSFVFSPKPPLVAPQMQVITNIIRIRNPDDRAKINCLVENPALTNRPVDAVVFHDSYGRAFRQFFGYSFHRTVFVWENKEFNPKVISENHPQIVISEMLERYFNIEDPEEMIASEKLP
jgi:hypothetical protein